VDSLIDAMMAAAREGGAVARRHFDQGVATEWKADRSPVTAADREAEAAIIARLRRDFPDHGFLGEETGTHGASAARFIVDPIDGTRNFIRGLPFWGTLLALEEDGVVTAGVVYVPVTGECFTARRGRGAFLDGERLRVSGVGTLGEAVLLHASLTLFRRDGRWDGLVRLIDATERQRSPGDFYGYTMIAQGRAEIGMGLNVKPWDLAPLSLIVEEAGGRFTDLDGIPTISAGSALATNARLHDQVTALLRQI
jgi:histidinol-phosphatase